MHFAYVKTAQGANFTAVAVDIKKKLCHHTCMTVHVNNVDVRSADATLMNAQIHYISENDDFFPKLETKVVKFILDKNNRVEVTMKYYVNLMKKLCGRVNL